jgi:UDP-N-acetylglucosamine 2-epimerase
MDGSVIGIEAKLLGKQLFAINFTHESYENNILHLALPKNSIQFIEEYDELIQNILKSLGNKDSIEQEKIIQDHNYYNDGNATDRIYEYLINN